MFKDIDLTLREMGAGDLGVGKRVKIMSENFMGRLIKYSQSLQMLNNSKINLGLAEKDLKDATLIAKSNGIISDVNAHEGLLVSSNSMLGTF